MKTIFTLIFALIMMLTANAQEGVKREKALSSSKQIMPDAKKEALKKKFNYPDKKDYKSDEDYAKAKAKWIKANPEKYQKVLGKKEDGLE